jgi:hypothetical protein
MSKKKFVNAPTYATQPNVLASDVAFSIHSAVDSAFFDVKYPEYEWYQFVNADQVMSDVNPGATSYAYITRDKQGSAAFIGNGPNDNIPMVAQSIGAVQVPIAYSAVGAQVTNEDARQYQLGFNANLAQDLGSAMRKACDNLVESTVLFGTTAVKDMNPLLNYPGITAQTVSGGTWDTKTPVDIVNDINNALTYMWKNSRTLFKPTLIFVPLDQYGLLSATPMVIGGVGLAVTILEYVRTNNVMTRVTGRELDIIPSRYLYNASPTQGARMIVMDRNRDNQCLPFPMPYTLSAPIPAPLAATWFAEQKFGSYHIRQQGSVLYVDGI